MKSYILPCLLLIIWSSCHQKDSNPLPVADLQKIDPALFADDELDLPYYVAHFHRVANSVSGTQKGRSITIHCSK